MPAATPARPVNQWVMLGQRRYGPFFVAQALAAGADNLLKLALSLMLSAQAPPAWLPPGWAGPVVGMTFLLPFLVCSLWAAPRIGAVDTTLGIRLLKGMELAIMALAVWGFFHANVACLMVCVALMGVQSASLGPLKYAYLRERLGDRELMGGNGMVLAGAVTAMFAGHVLASAMIERGELNRSWLAWLGLAVAAVGALAAWRMPLLVPGQAGGMKAALFGARPPPAGSGSPRGSTTGAAAQRHGALAWRPWADLRQGVQLARQDPMVLQALLGLAWMWFIGAFYLSQMGTLARGVLGSAHEVTALLLAMFALGLLIAAIFCEAISRQSVETGLVLIGAMGVGSFGGDLYFSTQGWNPQAGQGPLSMAAFWAREGSGRILYDLFRLGLGLGLFGIPLYALIQWRAPAGQTARLMALGNVLNTLFLLSGFLLSAALVWWGLSVQQLFMLGAVLNAMAVIYFFIAMPEVVVRMVVLVVTRMMYRLHRRGEDAWPHQGPAVMVCNHVGWLDPIFLAQLSPRPLLVIADPAALRWWGLAWYHRRTGALAAVRPEDDPAAFAQLVQKAQQALDAGGLVCVFPEGAITPDGRVQPFIDLVPQIVAGRDVPVVPAALGRVWGSCFSRIDGRPLRRPFRRGFYNKIFLTLGAPLTPQDASTERLAQEVRRLAEEPVP